MGAGELRGKRTEMNEDLEGGTGKDCLIEQWAEGKNCFKQSHKNKRKQTEQRTGNARTVKVHLHVRELGITRPIRLFCGPIASLLFSLPSPSCSLCAQSCTLH